MPPASSLPSAVAADLTIVLTSSQAQFVEGEPIAFRASYRNSGPSPYTLTFWWNRRMRVVDSAGVEVAPGPGPVLPSGVVEELTTLEPGAVIERDEPLACTQPAGGPASVGWSYALSPGHYRAVLIFAFPPKHGLLREGARAWRGQVESNAVEFEVVERPGLLDRLFGR